MLANFWNKTKICCSKTCRRRKGGHDEETDLSDTTSEIAMNDVYSEGGDLPSAESMVSNPLNCFNIQFDLDDLQCSWAVVRGTWLFSFIQGVLQ